MSESAKKSGTGWWMLGRKPSDTTRAKMSEVAKGKVVSISTRRKMSENRKGKPTLLRGKPWTEARRKAQPPKKSVIKGNKEYHPNWHGIRKQIYELHSWTCQECGIKCVGKDGKSHKKIQCHHIDYDIKNNNPSNLITLCASCHMKTNFNREDWQNYFKTKLKKGKQ